MQRCSHVFVDAHPNDEGFDQNAFRLEGTTDRTWVFVASFNAISDEDDHIPARHVGKVVSGFFKGACNGCRSSCLDSPQAAASMILGSLAPKGTTSFVSSQFCVLGCAWFHGHTPEVRVPIRRWVGVPQGLANSLVAVSIFALSTPKGIHAVGRVKHKQNPCDSYRGVCCHLGPGVDRERTKPRTRAGDFTNGVIKGRASSMWQEVSSPPTTIQAGSVRWQVAHRWERCHAICVCPP